MSSKQQDVTTHRLISELSKTIEAIGVEKTAGILIDSRSRNKAIEFMDFVIDMVCKKFNMTFAQITERKNNNNKRVLALKFISFYCFNQGIGENKTSERKAHEEISAHLSRTRRLVSKYITEMGLRKEDKKDAIQKYFKDFDAQVEKYVSLINNKK